MGNAFNFGQTALTVTVAASAGANTATLPQTGLTLIGVQAISGVYWVGIAIDSTRTAYLPLTANGGSSANMTRVNFKVVGNQLNFTVPYAGTVLFYFGNPVSDAPTLVSYAGVLVKITNSATVGTAVNTTFNFPSGNLKLTGVAQIGESASASFGLQWTPQSGYTINFESFDAMVGGEDMITPVAMLSLGTSLVVSTVSTVASAVEDAILYYQ